MTEAQLTEVLKDVPTAIIAIIRALVAGCHSLYLSPIHVNKALGSKISRLPLCSWVNDKDFRYLVVAEITGHYKCSIGQVAQALHLIKDNRLAYVDSKNIDISDEQAVQAILEEVSVARGAGGSANAKLETTAKIYVRDLKCPKPAKTNNQGKPTGTPTWLTQPSNIDGDGTEDTEAIKDKIVDDAVQMVEEDMTEAEMEAATAPTKS